MNDLDILRAWWHPEPWRGSEAQRRSDVALRGEILVPKRPVGEGPDPLLRIFNPRCAHDRCSWTVMHCPECKAYTEAHWGDRILLGIDDPTKISGL